jgi:hypothetical protein
MRRASSFRVQPQPTATETVLMNIGRQESDGDVMAAAAQEVGWHISNQHRKLDLNVYPGPLCDLLCSKHEH